MRGAWSVLVVAAVGVAGSLAAGGACGALQAPLSVAPFALAPLYTRIEREELLDHPLRRRLYERIAAGEPPTTMALVSEVDASRSTVRHHLAKLEDGDLVTAVDVCREKRWFPRSEGSADRLRTRALLEVGATREVYEAVRAAPGASLTGIADRLGRDPAVVHRVVDRLVEAGLVERERDGPRTEHRPAGV